MSKGKKPQHVTPEKKLDRKFLLELFDDVSVEDSQLPKISGATRQLIRNNKRQTDLFFIGFRDRIACFDLDELEQLVIDASNQNYTNRKEMYLDALDDASRYSDDIFTWDLEALNFCCGIEEIGEFGNVTTDVGEENASQVVPLIAEVLRKIIEDNGLLHPKQKTFFKPKSSSDVGIGKAIIISIYDKDTILKSAIQRVKINGKKAFGNRPVADFINKGSRNRLLTYIFNPSAV